MMGTTQGNCKATHCRRINDLYTVAPSSPALLPRREKGEVVLLMHENRYYRHLSHFANALVYNERHLRIRAI